MRVLVTGASGLVGGALVKVLSRDHEVFAVGRNVRSVEGVDEKHRVILDLAGDWDARSLPARFDAIVHLAQADNYREFPAAAESIFRVNTASTVRLLAAAFAAGASSFVLASSGGVYGNGPRAFREEDPIPLDTERSASGPLDFYLRTRRASEVLSASWSGSFPVVVLRFFFVYGPGQKSTMLIPRLVRSVKEGAPITLQGDEGMRLNPIHVEDAARATGAALTVRTSQTINIAGPDVLTMRGIGTAIGRAVGRDAAYSVDRGSKPADLFADISKMTSLLGAPSIRFEDGVRTLA